MRRIHNSCYIDDCVILPHDITIGPNCTIGWVGMQLSRGENMVPHNTPHTGGVKIGERVHIQPNTVIVRGLSENDYTTLGNDCLLGNLVNIGHNSISGNRNLFASGMIVGGSVVIGDDNFFGLGVIIKPEVTIGSRNMFGTGTVITDDIGDDGIYVGVPARRINDNMFFKGVIK